MDDKRSREDLEEDIKTNPNDPIAWKELGNYHLDLGKIEEARKCYEKAIKIDEKYPIPYYNIALTYYTENNHEKCLEFLNRTISIDPKFSDAYYLIGVVQLRNSRFDESIASLTRAIDLKSEDEDYYFMRGHAKVLKWENLSNQTALNTTNGGLMYHSEIYKYQFNLDLLKAAVTDFEKAFLINNDHVGTTFNLGYAYKRLSLLDKSEKMLRRSIQLNPEDLPSFELLVKVLIQNRKLLEAKKIAEQGINLNYHGFTNYLEIIDHFLGNVTQAQVDENKSSVQKLYEVKIEEFYDFLVSTEIIFNNNRQDIKKKLISLVSVVSNPFHHFIHEYKSVFSQYVKSIIVYHDKKIKNTLDEIRLDRHSDGEDRYNARHAIYRRMVPFFTNFDQVELIVEIASIPNLTDFSLREFIKYLSINLDVSVIFKTLTTVPSESKPYVAEILERTNFSEAKSDLKQLVVEHFDEFQREGKLLEMGKLDDLGLYLELYSSLVEDEKEELEIRDILYELLNRRIYVKRKLVKDPAINILGDRTEKLTTFEKREKELIISVIRCVGMGKFHSLEDMIFTHIDINKTTNLSKAWEETYRHLISFWEVDVYVIACFKTLVKLQTKYGLYGFYQILKTYNTNLNYQTFINSEKSIFNDPSIMPNFATWIETAIKDDDDTQKLTSFGNLVYGTLMYNFNHLLAKVKKNVIFLFYCISYLCLEWPNLIEVLTRSSMELKIDISFLFNPDEEYLDYHGFVVNLIDSNPQFFEFSK